MQSQVMCSWGPCLSREVGPGDLQCSLPTLTILWLCNFVIMADTFTLRCLYPPTHKIHQPRLLQLHSWHEGLKDIPPWCLYKRSVFCCCSLQCLSSSAVPTMLTFEFAIIPAKLPKPQLTSLHYQATHLFHCFCSILRLLVTVPLGMVSHGQFFSCLPR